MDDLLSWLQDGPLAEAIRGTALLYPLLGSLHIIGIALLIGPAVAFDLRLLGLGQQTLRVTTVGGYLLLPGASVMAERGSAPWKLGLLLIAGLNVLIFHRKTYRSVSAWDLGEPTPVPARTAAVVSLTSWMGVTVAGSLLAYT
jgi:hypothetical protein